MSNRKKVKIIDQDRANTLPRYITDDDINNSIINKNEKESKKLLSSSLNQTNRDEIRRLMKSEVGKDQSTLQRIEDKKRIENEKRKAHEAMIYTMDLDPLDTTFNLPGKPAARSTLPPELSRRTPTRKVAKINSNTEKNPQDVGMNFLPTLLGKIIFKKYFFFLILFLFQNFI